MKEEAVYQYRNANGSLVFEVVRFEGKKFPQRRYGADGKAIWNLDGVTLLPYRFNEWRFQYHDQWLFIPEGEKDVDRLWKEGLPATTNPLGAGKWREEFNDDFSGRRICLLPDNDEAGRNHVRDVATNLFGIASEIRVLELPNLEPKGDVSDWLEEHDKDELSDLLDEVTPITAEDVASWKAEPHSEPNPPKKTSDKKNSREPESPAEMELDLKELFFKVVDFISARIAVAEGDEWILAAFVMNTHVFEIFPTTPYVLLESAAPACGKTTAIQVLQSICHSPKVVTSPTPAVLFRMIEKYNPTLFIDEGEKLSGRGESVDAMKEVLNAGYKKGGMVYRCADGSRNHDLQGFEVYCPKVVAAIGGLTGALMDRHINIHMEPTDKRLAHSWEPNISSDSAPILKELRAFKYQYSASLSEDFSVIPRDSYWVEGKDKQPIFRGREYELFMPLLSIMRLIGSEMEKLFIRLASKSSQTKKNIAVESSPDLSRAKELFMVVSDELIFPTSLGERLQTSELIEPLVRLEEDWSKELKGDLDSKQNDASLIGKYLKRFRLKKKRRKMSGSTYDIEELKEALSKVLGTPLPSLQGDSQVTDTKTTNPIAVDSEPKRSAIQQALYDQQCAKDMAVIAEKQRVQAEKDKARENIFKEGYQLAGVDVDRTYTQAERDQIQMDGQTLIDEGKM